jgi:hypothetical protein
MKVTTIAFITNVVHDVNFLTVDDQYVVYFNFFIHILIKKMALTDRDYLDNLLILIIIMINIITTTNVLNFFVMCILF